MGLTSIVMIMVIVWAIKELGKDLGIADRIRNSKTKGGGEED